jgi:hypothetical protein
MTASRTSSEIPPLLKDEHMIWRAASLAASRIYDGMRAGRHSRWHAKRADDRVWEISREVDAGTLHPAIAALELLRVELNLARTAARKRRNA